jgi:hypothetical protein
MRTSSSSLPRRQIGYERTNDHGDATSKDIAAHRQTTSHCCCLWGTRFSFVPLVIAVGLHVLNLKYFGLLAQSWPVAAEARVQSQARPCGEQIGKKDTFSLNTYFSFHLTPSFHQCSILIYHRRHIILARESVIKQHSSNTYLNNYIIICHQITD